MKFPLMNLDDAGERLERAEQDMAAIRTDIAEIKRLLDLLITVQFSLAGLDRPTDL